MLIAAWGEGQNLPCLALKIIPDFSGSYKAPITSQCTFFVPPPVSPPVRLE